MVRHPKVWRCRSILLVGVLSRYTIPEIKGKKSDKIHIIFSKIGNAPQVSHMYLDDFIYRKDYVVGVRKVPNRYRAGGEVVINSENDTVLVDNISKIVDVVQGSDFITIPPASLNSKFIAQGGSRTNPLCPLNLKKGICNAINDSRCQLTKDWLHW